VEPWFRLDAAAAFLRIKRTAAVLSLGRIAAVTFVSVVALSTFESLDAEEKLCDQLFVSARARTMNAMKTVHCSNDPADFMIGDH
jgi:hypothetical protein